MYKHKGNVLLFVESLPYQEKKRRKKNLFSHIVTCSLFFCWFFLYTHYHTARTIILKCLYERVYTVISVCILCMYDVFFLLLSLKLYLWRIIVLNNLKWNPFLYWKSKKKKIWRYFFFFVFCVWENGHLKNFCAESFAFIKMINEISKWIIACVVLTLRRKYGFRRRKNQIKSLNYVHNFFFFV